MINTNIEQYIYDHKIKCDDLGNIYVKVIDSGLQFYPIDNLKDCIQINKEQLQGILNKTLKYDHATNTFTEIKNFTKEKRKIKLLKKQLSNTDYKAIKYAEGLISETDYTETKKLRQSLRNGINYLEGVISNG